MKPQDNYTPIRTLSLGGESDDRRPIPSQGLSKQRVQEQRVATKSGMAGLAHQHPMGGIAPGGGGETPPPGKGGPPDDKGDDELKEEDEEDDTDEETVSVTSSSQVSAKRAGLLIWGGGQANIKDREGVHLRTQMILLEEEVLEMVIEDHEGTEARGVELDHLEGMEQWDQWDPLDQGDSQEGMVYPPLGVHSLPQDWEYPLHSMQT